MQTLKDKDVSKNNFSGAAVFFIIGAVSLILTAWGFTGSSTKAKDLRITNQTKVFQVVNAETVGDELKMTLRNISEKSCRKSELDDHQQENDWTYIGTSKEGVKLSYSPERTVKRGRLIQAWFKGEHPDTDQKISSNIALHEFNCTKGTYRLLQSTLFFRDGSAHSSNQPSAWEHPLPDSVAEMELKQVCRKKSSRKNDLRSVASCEGTILTSSASGEHRKPGEIRKSQSWIRRKSKERSLYPTHIPGIASSTYRP